MAHHAENASAITSHSSLKKLSLIMLTLVLLTIGTCAGYNAALIRSVQAAAAPSCHTEANIR